jgi:hypothetical protein
MKTFHCINIQLHKELRLQVNIEVMIPMLQLSDKSFKLGVLVVLIFCSKNKMKKGHVGMKLFKIKKDKLK